MDNENTPFTLVFLLIMDRILETISKSIFQTENLLLEKTNAPKLPLHSSILSTLADHPIIKNKMLRDAWILKEETQSEPKFINFHVLSLFQNKNKKRKIWQERGKK